MATCEPILEHWIAGTIESYPAISAPFLSQQDDPFRNPVGHALRRSLTVLFEQLLGDMDTAAISQALDSVVRIRAVQNLTASDAVGFVFLLRPILRELAPERDLTALDDRIDKLALLAFDKYMRCREQIAEIRLKEGQRRVSITQAIG